MAAVRTHYSSMPGWAFGERRSLGEGTTSRSSASGGLLDDPATAATFYRETLAELRGRGFEVHVVTSPGPQVASLADVSHTVHLLPMYRRVAPLKDLVGLVRWGRPAPATPTRCRPRWHSEGRLAEHDGRADHRCLAAHLSLAGPDRWRAPAACSAGSWRCSSGSPASAATAWWPRLPHWPASSSGSASTAGGLSSYPTTAAATVWTPNTSPPAARCRARREPRSRGRRPGGRLHRPPDGRQGP